MRFWLTLIIVYGAGLLIGQYIHVTGETAYWVYGSLTCLAIFLMYCDCDRQIRRK